MAGDKDRLNGSVNLLADAMRKVFHESVQGAVEPVATEVKALRTEVHDMEGRINKRIDEGLKTTNENVQAQLAQHRKDINEDMAAMETRLGERIDQPEGRD